MHSCVQCMRSCVHLVYLFNASSINGDIPCEHWYNRIQLKNYEVRQKGSIVRLYLPAIVIVIVMGILQKPLHNLELVDFILISLV